MSPGNSGADPLVESQIERNRKQAEFFAKRSQQIDWAASQPPPRPSWTVEQWVACMAQIIAFLAFIATLVTSWISLSEMRRGREDTAFYETLERMGDKDSPIVRASAAELLASKASDPAYYESARSQLLHSLLLEDNPVVLGAIQDACVALSAHHAEDLRERLQVVHEKLKVQVLGALAPLTLDEQGRVPSEMSNIDDERWAMIESLIPQTELTRQDLQPLIVEREATFDSYQQIAVTTWANLPEDERAELAARWAAEFQAAALRLRLTRRLLEDAKKLID